MSASDDAPPAVKIVREVKRGQPVELRMLGHTALGTFTLSDDGSILDFLGEFTCGPHDEHGGHS